MNAFISDFSQDLTESRINNLRLKVRKTIKFAENSKNKDFTKDNLEEIAEKEMEHKLGELFDLKEHLK